MVKLNECDPSNFVLPFAMLYGRNGRIEADCKEDLEITSTSVCIAMEVGIMSQEKYRPPLTPNECLDIAEKCLQIVRSAARCGIVLMDLKPANIIGCMSAFRRHHFEGDRLTSRVAD